ncbi:hypothetical protein Sjap_020453 [Stephania japonica]|uniref:Uncharacterized protein n=1 Tax=Stephania japonica TaxID=461633 RepID=A0AAP0I0P5_9MAGN
MDSGVNKVDDRTMEQTDGRVDKVDNRSTPKSTTSRTRSGDLEIGICTVLGDFIPTNRVTTTDSFYIILKDMTVTLSEYVVRCEHMIFENKENIISRSINLQKGTLRVRFSEGIARRQKEMSGGPCPSLIPDRFHLKQRRVTATLPFDTFH